MRYNCPGNPGAFFLPKESTAMKDYARILESANRSTLQQIVPLKPQKGELTEWSVLKQIEDMALKMRSELRHVMEPGLSETASHVKLDVFSAPQKGARLFLKAQLFGLGKKEVLLKVFAHQIAANGKAVKLARASYHLTLKREEAGWVA